MSDRTTDDQSERSIETSRAPHARAGSARSAPDMSDLDEALAASQTPETTQGTETTNAAATDQAVNAKRGRGTGVPQESVSTVGQHDNSQLHSDSKATSQVGGAPIGGAQHEALTPQPDKAGAADDRQPIRRDLEFHDMTDVPANLDRSEYPYLKEAQPTTLESVAESGPCPDFSQEFADNRDGRAPVPLKFHDTFQGWVEPFDMEPGTTYYRVVGHPSRPDGEFWTDRPPRTAADVRGELAIRNSWNGDHGVVAYTPTERVRGWAGTVAPQQATGRDDLHLAGGGRQIYIPPGSLSRESGRWRIARLDLDEDEKS